MDLMVRSTFEVYCRIAYAFIYKYKHGTREEFCERYGKSTRTLQGYEKRMRELQLIPSHYNSRSEQLKQRKPSAAENCAVVENVEDVIDAVATVVTPDEKERRPDESHVEWRQRIKQTPTNTQPNVRRHQPERPSEHVDAGHLGDDTYWNVDAEHYQHVQDSDEPDSYKQAQYLLTQFDKLLRNGSRDGWSQEAFNSIRYDLDGWARTCAACSDNYRERADERAEEVWAGIQTGVLRGESGSGTPGIESSELD